MTKPTEEAARIVAKKLNREVSEVMDPRIKTPYTFAQYVTDEYEVTDAMDEAGRDMSSAGGTNADIFRAMIAAKHKDALAGGDPLVGVVNELGLGLSQTAADELVEALAKRGGRIVFDGIQDQYDRERDTPQPSEPVIDEDTVKREARETMAKANEARGFYGNARYYRNGEVDDTVIMQALIATTRRALVAEAKLGGAHHD